jgi:hypothetical protein
MRIYEFVVCYNIILIAKQKLSLLGYIIIATDNFIFTQRNHFHCKSNENLSVGSVL